MEKAGRVGDGGPRGPVLHIVVVGFHHKKGCQVEFSYPPLIPGDGHDSHTLPEEWKYLPFLALPDGAHNYQEDTVFFHLPPRNGNGATVYGISCYRQIEAKALKVRQADITRETVQKSVCVLSKLELYEHMNSSLGGTSLEGSQVYLGLSPRDLVLHFRHKVLILFKLILLEKKVLFYISPVNKLVGALMTVLSLFPGMIEHGLGDCSQYRPRKSMSEDGGLQENNPPAYEFVSASASDTSNTNLGTVKKILSGNHGGDSTIKTKEPLFQVDNSSKGQEPNNSNQYLKPPSRPSPESSESDWETLDPSVLEDPNLKEQEQLGSDQTNLFPKDSVPSESPPITVQPQANTGQVVLIPGLISGLEEDQYGMPLAIFTKGYLCLPYMALQQHHLLSDVTVRGFVAGATNILFRQQKHLSDAIVEVRLCVEEALIQIHDPELRKLLNPTTADLRFADYLVRHVTENRDDVFLDGTGWEGGDEWIRAQFAVYIHALLAATLQLDNEKILSDYGTTFVTAWKNTHNYRVWNSNKHPALAEINPNHPFQGQYSVSDMKLRFSHSVQNSERGKKIGNVMVTTSRNVVQTGKAVGQSVGGAFSSAKTAMSSWLSTFTTSTPQSLTEPPDGKP
ncbi:late secretory pathway protein AVL9 homolog isoform X3 [Nycticebus coucang]|uniref:late secretory pathway protein AVL9 homolog isoform X3 n=1 Tax=Nycticebus coucang TaxID=9470 RepID=UPI00234C5F7A|nr:late secretory pathway protein AVL9 homolog isoform X3 [Nycticebus coucang]